MTRDFEYNSYDDADRIAILENRAADLERRLLAFAAPDPAAGWRNVAMPGGGPLTGPEPGPVASAGSTTPAPDGVVESLGRKLGDYAATLSEEERALLLHVLLTALPSLERREFLPDADVISDADRALLDSLTQRK